MAYVRKPRNRDDFTIAIICALPNERDAVMEMLDEHWKAADYRKAAGDQNTYRLGRIGPHNIVVAQLPGIGPEAAASASASLGSSFLNITLGLVVGVCGGVPTTTTSGGVLMGDVIISKIIVDYTFGWQYDARLQTKDTLADRFGRPAKGIRAFLATMEGRRDRTQLKNDSSKLLLELCEKDGFESFRFPGIHKDVLYIREYRHKHQRDPCPDCEKCKASEDKLETLKAAGHAATDDVIQRAESEVMMADICAQCERMTCEYVGCSEKRREERNCSDRSFRLSQGTMIRVPEIHFGTIGSGNSVMKSAFRRDQLAKEKSIIAFEMEGAGVWDNFPTVIIKAVSDYADGHKNKEWQNYAAASAAACMKAFLMEWAANERASARTHDIDYPVYPQRTAPSHIRSGVRSNDVSQTWQRKKLLGRGGFGEVWQEIRREKNGDYQYRAVKICSEAKMQQAGIDYKSELAALVTFSKLECNTWFVNLFTWWIDLGDVYIAMEHLGRGDLSNYITSEIPERGIEQIATCVLRGLEVMHRHGYAHRDVKPKNILVVENATDSPRWWVKIADFGICKQTSANPETDLHTNIGTKRYQAPEVGRCSNQERLGLPYTNKVDMWSFGCVLFNLGSRGQHPFHDNDSRRVLLNPQNCPVHLSSNGKKLIKALLEVDPEKRLSATAALQHPWFTAENIDVVQSNGLPKLATSNPAFEKFQNPESKMTASPSLVPSTSILQPATHCDTKQAAESDDVPDMPITRRSRLVRAPANAVVPTQMDARKTSAPLADKQVISRDKPNAHGQRQLLSALDLYRVRSDGGPGRHGAALDVPGSACYEVSKWLRTNKARMTTSWNTRGDTALHLAAEDGITKVMRSLFEEGANANVRNNTNSTPLHYAIRLGRMDAMKLLLEMDANVNAKDTNGWTPLHVAAAYNQLEAVKWLLEHSANVHESDNAWGWTPMFRACAFGHVEVMKWLAHEGADMDATDSNGRTLGQFAKKNQQSSVLKWLREQEQPDANR